MVYDAVAEATARWQQFPEQRGWSLNLQSSGIVTKMSASDKRAAGSVCKKCFAMRIDSAAVDANVALPDMKNALEPTKDFVLLSKEMKLESKMPARARKRVAPFSLQMMAPKADSQRRLQLLESPSHRPVRHPF